MTLERARLYKTASRASEIGDWRYFVQVRFPEVLEDGSIRFQCYDHEARDLGYVHESELQDFCL